jgi:hypothetical protein
VHGVDLLDEQPRELSDEVENGWQEHRLVHDKALLEFNFSVANIVATVAGLLALFPQQQPWETQPVRPSNRVIHESLD